MTMVAHMRGPSGRAARSSARPYPDGAKAHLATLKRVLAGVLTSLAAGSALAAIMALKIAIYLPRLTHP